MKRYGWVRR
jgi:hypothetical protein